MKLIINILLVTFLLSSCNDDVATDNTVVETNIAGKWSIDHMEYKSKNYAPSVCDLSDVININDNMSGIYQNSERDSNSSLCSTVNDIAGVWNIDKVNNKLVLTYKENNNSLTKTFSLDGISNNQLRIVNNKAIENVGVVEVVEIWIKK